MGVRLFLIILSLFSIWAPVWGRPPTLNCLETELRVSLSDDPEIQAVFAPKDPTITYENPYPKIGEELERIYAETGKRDNKVMDEVDKKYRSISKSSQPRLFALAEELLSKNVSKFIVADQPRNERDFTLKSEAKVKIEEILITRGNHPYYPSFDVKFSYGASGEDVRNREATMRTNGRAAFLQSWGISQANSGQDFKFVYFDELRNIHEGDQTEVILKSLPSGNILLSRTMAHEEFELWKGGEPKRIKSYITIENMPAESRIRTFFALNYFKFGDGKQPYLFEFPKSVLEDLYKSGQLVINPYTDSLRYPENSSKGMPAEARTPFGLEVEVVVLGEKGREKIMPYMQSPMKEGQ